MKTDKFIKIHRKLPSIELFDISDTHYKFMYARTFFWFYLCFFSAFDSFFNQLILTRMKLSRIKGFGKLPLHFNSDTLTGISLALSIILFHFDPKIISIFLILISGFLENIFRPKMIILQHKLTVLL